MSTELMILLSILEPVALVVILGVALTMVAARLEAISSGLGSLGAALASVESQHLRPIEQLVNAINPPMKIIVDTLPVIAGKAAYVVKKVTGG